MPKQNQFANDSMTPPPIEVNRNKEMDEIPVDRPMHDNATPEQNGPLYFGDHYSYEFLNGYGVEVGKKEPSKETTATSGDQMERGKEN